jgi:type IV pilus assembly protein PilB
VARQRIGELLVSAGVITESDLARALETERAPGQKLGDVLVQLGIVSEAQLTQVLGQQFSVPWVSLYHIDFSRQLLNLISRTIADKYCLIPIYVRRVKRQDTLYVAMADPSNESALDEVSKVVGLPAKPMIAAPSDIRNAIRVYYGAGPAAVAVASNVSPKAVSQAPTPAASVPPSEASSPPPTKISVAPPAASPEPPPVADDDLLEEEGPPTVLEDPQTVEIAAARNAEADRPSLFETAESPAAPRDLAIASESGASESGASQSGDSPDAEPEIEAREIVVKPKFGGPMIAITMLDGTTIQLPQRKKKRETDEEEAPMSEVGGLTARDLIAALRAVAQGHHEGGAVLGDDGKWEKLYATLLSLLLRKGLIADWEFIEELRKM